MITNTLPPDINSHMNVLDLPGVFCGISVAGLDKLPGDVPAFVVIVDEGLVDLGGVGDSLHCRSVIALLDEELLCRLDDPCRSSIIE